MEFNKQVAQLVNLPNYIKGMNLLRDISVTTLPTGYDLEWIKKDYESRVKSQDQKLGSDRKAAWVVGNANDFKLIHQFCAITRLSHNIVDRQPFRNMDRAFEWLDIPEDYEFKFPPF
jgi:hypothetical protein